MSHPETIKYLRAMCDGMTERELCGCWCDLQRYIWPMEFQNVKPDGFETLSRKQKNQMPIYMALWNIIVANTTEYSRLRAWNCEMTQDEFEDYWKMINNQDEDYE